MAANRASCPLRGLTTCLSQARNARSATTTPTIATRSLATEAEYKMIMKTIPYIPEHLAPRPALTTVYDFPHMQPLRFRTYPSSHLLVPLRRDILHRALIFEGDSTRQGTASTKWRTEVHGSNRKMRPQKGTGMARIGDKKSPIIVGGGKAFGPKPRDFSTELNRKVYDLAWRMALSYRYRRGELIVVDEKAEVRSDSPGFLEEVFQWNRVGKSVVGRGPMIVTQEENQNLMKALKLLGPSKGVAKKLEDVDVKNLLEGGRLIIEERALIDMLYNHQTDLAQGQRGLSV